MEVRVVMIGRERQPVGQYKPLDLQLSFCWILSVHNRCHYWGAQCSIGKTFEACEWRKSVIKRIRTFCCSLSSKRSYGERLREACISLKFGETVGPIKTCLLWRSFGRVIIDNFYILWISDFGPKGCKKKNSVLFYSFVANNAVVLLQKIQRISWSL